MLPRFATALSCTPLPIPRQKSSVTVSGLLHLSLELSDINDAVSLGIEGGCRNRFGNELPKVWTAVCQSTTCTKRLHSDKWHLDEVVITIKQQYYLWRAVDAEGNVLDVFTTAGHQGRRAFCKLPKKQRLCATVIVTDRNSRVTHRQKKQVMKRVTSKHIRG